MAVREMLEQAEKPEIAVLVGLDTGEYDAEVSMRELRELAETAGAQVEAEVLQKRATPEAKSYLGTGRLEELAEYCKNNEVDLIIVDGELTPTQQRNIEKATDVRTIDRTMLILDIFALNAKTSEGKLQVMLAQLEYSLPRLMGKGVSLSRLGAGIGTRGPGESKLESDRRHIRRRIRAIREQLEQVERRRANIRIRRKKNRVETVAIVGYTNAGKSTLMNALTEAGVLVENKLFATLDPTARNLRLQDGREVMLVDTVGFIRRLPHHLVEAFHSTLEEAVHADVIVNVCDASSPEAMQHLDVTMQVLEDLGCAGKPVIPVLNKCDLLSDFDQLPVIPGSVRISAVTREGLEDLLQAISAALPQTRHRVQLLIPFSQGAVVGKLRNEGVVFSEEFREDGFYMDVLADVEYLDTIRNLIL